MAVVRESPPALVRPRAVAVGSGARGATRADQLLRAGVMLGAVASLVGQHVMLLGYQTFANVDEAYAAALAERLLDGHRLYEGAISQRGPLMYYAYEAIARVAGWDNVMGLRACALGLALVQVAIVAWAATRLVSHRAGSLAAAFMTYILVAGLPPLDGIALHGETMQAPLVVAGAAIGFVAMRPAERRAGWLLALSGGLFGLAITIKQSALLQPLPVIMYLFARSRRASGRPAPWRALAAFLGGIVFVVGAFALHAAASGTLAGLIYYCFTYNLKVHLRPTDILFTNTTIGPLAEHTKRMTAFLVLTIALCVPAITFSLRRLRAAAFRRSGYALVRGFGVHRYLGAHAVVATLTASSMYRFFPHYYLPALPFVAIAAAAWFARRVRVRGVDALRATAALLTIAVVVVGGLSAYAYEKIDGEVTHGPLVKRLSRYIEATTPRDASVFVWGFSPWFYSYSHRKPAGRYVFETYVTGFVPWFFDAYAKEKDRIVPGSLEALLGDLDRERPEIVLDAGSVLLSRPMRAYPKAAAWLHAGYCFEVRLSAYDVYRRKTSAGCTSDAFPRVHSPVDYFGQPVPVPMPLVVDEATSRPLCARADDEPVWFADFPSPPAAGLATLVPPDRAKIIAEHRAAGIAYPSELAPPVTCTEP